MAADSVTPFGFESLPVRGALVHLSRSWRRMLRDHDYDSLVTETLGHATAATALIAQSLKFDGSITLQLQRGKGLEMLVVQCSSNLEVRGMAVPAAGEAASTFGELTRDAYCAVTVDAGERPYQGIVEVSEESLAMSLEQYFMRSAQVPTHIMLVANEAMAGGVLLQQVPGQPIADDDWTRLHLVAATLRCQDFDDGGGLPLVGRLFAEDDVRVYRPRSVIFRCRCSARRTEDVLKMLGEEESREALAERGAIDVTCEYCGRRRRFDAVDVERLFADNVVAGTDSVQ